MITAQVFLLGLLIVSTITGLSTEAIKKLMDEANKQYRSNLLAGIVSTVISLAIGISYVLLKGYDFNTRNVIFIISLIFMSWLCSMLGYDKVIQSISQFKTVKEKGEQYE